MVGARPYFGDERCLPHDHTDSNCGMAMQTLFQNGIHPERSSFHMESDTADRVLAVEHYLEIYYPTLTTHCFLG